MQIVKAKDAMGFGDNYIDAEEILYIEQSNLNPKNFHVYSDAEGKHYLGNIQKNYIEISFLFQNENGDFYSQIPEKIEKLEYEQKMSLAENGYSKDLDILVNDSEPSVRYAVAEHGRDKDLDILVHDERWEVREVVAKCGRDKDLDVLVNDEDEWVRVAVAEHGRDEDLDILVNDKDEDVLIVVAKQGRSQDLDVLKNDENSLVSDIATKKIIEQSNNFKLDNEAKDMSRAATIQSDQRSEQIIGKDER